MKLAFILVLAIAAVSSFTTVNRNANDESDFEMGSEDYDYLMRNEVSQGSGSEYEMGSEDYEDLMRDEGSQEGDMSGSGSKYEMGSEDYEDLMGNEGSQEGDRSGSGFSECGSGTQ